MKDILLILISIVLISSCKNKDCPNGGGYLFEIPVTLSPARDTFNIGDTITISSIFSDTIFDRKTNMDYLLEDFKFYPGSEMVRIDTVDANPEFESNFEVLIDDPFNYDSFFGNFGDVLVGQYNYENDIYSLTFKLVTKESGLFYLEQSSSLGRMPIQDFPGSCRLTKSDGISVMNNGSDNNIDMLSSSPDPHYNDWILSDPDRRFHMFGGYCFYVKE